jgi:hypothetical protein
MKIGVPLNLFPVYLLTLSVKNWAQLLTIYNYNKINFENGHFMYFCQYL